MENKPLVLSKEARVVNHHHNMEMLYLDYQKEKSLMHRWKMVSLEKYHLHQDSLVNLNRSKEKVKMYNLQMYHLKKFPIILSNKGK